MDLEKIGRFIKSKRLSKGLTQEELADKLKVSNKSVSKWENGNGLMDISLLEPLSKILDINVIDILNGGVFKFANSVNPKYDDMQGVHVNY